MVSRLESLHGCLLGGGMGDALGLPYERLSPQKIQKMLPASSAGALGANASSESAPVRGGLDLSLLPSRGLFSDDTEHALLTARALLESRGDPQTFGRYLRGELRPWFFTLPPGIGLATLKASLKAAIFLPNTGVHSAGNGPAMRAPILGAFFHNSTRQLREFCDVSTHLTHLDPRAKWGAFAVALAASEAANGRCDARRFVRELCEWSDDSDAARETISLAKSAANSASRGQSTAQFCAEMGLENGVSGYILHTVPVVLQCWLRHDQNFRAALEEIVLCGGDTDTTAAILGGIIGARVGASRLPLDWEYGLVDFPNTRGYIQRVAQEMESAEKDALAVVAPRVLIGAPLLRNAVFVGILLVHVVKRAVTR